MPTDTIDPSNAEQTPEKDSPATEEATPDDGTTAKLEEQLAAEKEARTKFEEEAKRWKGRLEKANEALKDEEKTPESEPEDDRISELEWKLENKDRINNVKEDYEKILAEGFNGEKVSSKIALELAEKMSNIDETAGRERQAANSSPSIVNRDSTPKVELSEYDKRMGITEEIKKKWAPIVNGQ